MEGENARERSWLLLNLANIFSVMRLALVPFVIWFIIESSAQDLVIDGWRWAALICFVFAASTDFIDGQIARRTDTITEFGKLVDPLADRLLVISVLVTLMAVGFLPLWMGILIVSRDLLMLAGAPLVGINRQEVRDRLAVHWTGKAATAFLFGAICFFLILNTQPYWISDSLPVCWYGFVLFCIGVVFSYVSGFIYIFRGIDILRNLRQEEEETA
jgi:CDP-diacylglycerol--glycerol-3-phosphate 3-phosphatidyltransferase